MFHFYFKFVFQEPNINLSLVAFVKERLNNLSVCFLAIEMFQLVVYSFLFEVDDYVTLIIFLQCTYAFADILALSYCWMKNIITFQL